MKVIRLPMHNYKPRLLEKDIIEKLTYSGAVYIEGPKWAGKSTTAMLFSKTNIKFQNPIIKKQYQTLVTISKEEVLAGEPPILFDEWQEVPEVWDFIRLDIDERNLKGAYLLTGSTKKQTIKISHTGTGRINTVYMRPMSLFESGDSLGTVSLAELFANQKIKPVRAKITLNDIAKLVCRGGWPGSIELNESAALRVPSDLLVSIINRDAEEVDGVRKDKTKFTRFIQSYARNISTLATDKTIYEDQSGEGFAIDAKTYQTYLNALERLYIIENVSAWSPNIRSASTIRSASKKQFVDPSIAVASLGLSPEKLKQDFRLFGFFFESIVTRDVRVYANYLGGDVFYYRDTSGLEVDLIIELNDGKWGAIEVKMGENELEKAAVNLLKLQEIVIGPKPSFMMVITNTELAYQREDGVYVIPIGCLKP